MPKIVYIAGYGHSGSTLYGIILGSGPRFLNLGEVHRLGMPKEASRIDAPHLKAALGGVRVNLKRHLATSNDDLRAVAGIESILALNLRGVRSNPGYARFWHGVFKIISNETGAEVLIDSSKTAWGQFERPKLLRDAGHDVFLLHLIKDPRDLVFSRWRRMGIVHGVKSLFGWLITNWLTWHSYKLWGPRYLISMYDDFSRDPETELTNIGIFIGEDLSPAIAQIRSGVGFDPGLQIGGNQAGRHQKVFWKPFIGWQKEAPLFTTFVGTLGVPLFHYLKKRQLKRRARPL